MPDAVPQQQAQLTLGNGPEATLLQLNKINNKTEGVRGRTVALGVCEWCVCACVQGLVRAEITEVWQQEQH